MEGPQLQLQPSSSLIAPPPPQLSPPPPPVPPSTSSVGVVGVEEDTARMVVENVISLATSQMNSNSNQSSSSESSTSNSSGQVPPNHNDNNSTSNPHHESQPGPSTSASAQGFTSSSSAGPSSSSSSGKRSASVKQQDDREGISVKKPRLVISKEVTPSREQLASRLNGILSCTVCFDLPLKAIYQCQNGHLMCVGCLMHILADARLKDETATCPNCRVVISKDICQRNLAVEKAVCELPCKCKFCGDEYPRATLDKHQYSECEERATTCLYSVIGCPWRGPHHEATSHEVTCIHPNKKGRELLDAIKSIESHAADEQKLYSSIFDLLSLEKITFNDLQMKPYRTDEFIHKLYYETSRFSAFGSQWVVKTRVNDDQRDPSQSVDRRLSYQLVCKSKITNPMLMQFILLKGPFGDAKILPRINRYEFSETSNESAYFNLPLIDTNECNKLLASKAINVRLIMFQVLK